MNGTPIVTMPCALAAGMSLAGLASKRYAQVIRPFSPPALAFYVAAFAASIVIARNGADGFAGMRMAAVLAVTTVAAVTDLQTGLMYDAVTFPALLLLAIAACLGRQPAVALTGAVAGGAIPGVLYALTRGRGIGLGDVKLGACIGCALGAAAAAYAWGAAFVAGGAVASALLLSGRAARGSHIRFGPYLVLGTTWVLLWAR